MQHFTADDKDRICVSITRETLFYNRSVTGEHKSLPIDPGDYILMGSKTHPEVKNFWLCVGKAIHPGFKRAVRNLYLNGVDGAKGPITERFPNEIFYSLDSKGIVNKFHDVTLRADTFDDNLHYFKIFKPKPSSCTTDHLLQNEQ